MFNNKNVARDTQSVYLMINKIIGIKTQNCHYDYCATTLYLLKSLIEFKQEIR